MLIHGSAAGMPPFRGGFQAPGQPEGLPDISRGLSASDTPGTPSKPNRTLEGCQNCVLLEWHILRPRISGTIPGSIPIPFHNRCVELSKSAIVVFWHPSGSGVREISCPVTGGIVAALLDPRLISGSPPGCAVQDHSAPSRSLALLTNRRSGSDSVPFPALDWWLWITVPA